MGQITSRFTARAYRSGSAPARGHWKLIANVRPFLSLFLLGLPLICHIHAVEAAERVDEAEQAHLGRSIYEKGIGRDGRDISAVVHGSVRLSGAAIACNGCHGNQGRGGGEAFIQAPDIRWLSLSKRYPARRIGFTETSYDEASFAKALRTGLTAVGRTLDPAMPRFDLADDEIRGLIAYLGIIDETENAKQQQVILGLLPTPGQHSLTDALDAELKNCAASRSGTLIAAVDMIYFDTPKDAIAKLNKRLSVSPAPIILAPFLAGWEQSYHQAVEHTDAMTVLPFSLRDPSAEHHWLFSFPGVESQIMALLKSARASGYRHVQLRYDAGNSLSQQLAIITQKLAASLQLSLMSEHNEKTSDTLKSATVWLQPVNPNQLDWNSSRDELMLVPVIFFKPDRTKPGEQSISFGEWRIAYSYPPRNSNKDTWRTPVEVWAGAACEFLALAAQKKLNYTDLPETLQWETDLAVHRRPHFEALVDQVFIDKFPQP
ncbi:MAG: hypothetical protein IT524_02175 [Nitrosomonas sp.]|nr:hypothetical protein [Nitrosomonas sp.]